MLVESRNKQITYIVKLAAQGIAPWYDNFIVTSPHTTIIMLLSDFPILNSCHVLVSPLFPLFLHWQHSSSSWTHPVELVLQREITRAQDGGGMQINLLGTAQSVRASACLFYAA